MDSVFEATNLSKRFGPLAALDGVELSIRPHSIVGLLGRNGSGKTTLMRHALGLHRPT